MIGCIFFSTSDRQIPGIYDGVPQLMQENRNGSARSRPRPFLLGRFTTGEKQVIVGLDQCVTNCHRMVGFHRSKRPRSYISQAKRSHQTVRPTDF